MKIQYLILSLISKEKYHGELTDVHEKPEFQFLWEICLKTCYH